MLENFIRRVQQRESTIGIIGLGYVGLPLALKFCGAGFTVTGIDCNEQRIARINSGDPILSHLPPQALQHARASGRFHTTHRFDAVDQLDAIILCVPTPIGPHREVDMSAVQSAIRSILPHLRRGQLVSLESTVYPGATEEELATAIASRGLAVGRDVFGVFSPEREDPGNTHFHTGNIPKLVSGITPACRDAGVILYSSVVEKVVRVESLRVAEMAKMIENTFRFVNIGLVNELKMIADGMGIDIWEAIRAASTKPFGYMPFHPGPGLGGHCIPVDPFYLTWKAREHGMTTRFIELAGEINGGMPAWVVGKIGTALGDRDKLIHGARILLIGVAYKKNIEDTRESPALEIIQRLREAKAVVSYSDPYVPNLNVIRGGRIDMAALPLTPETVSAADCVVVVTDHDSIDYELIQRHASLIVDTRGRFFPGSPNVVGA
ncbi:MAG: nucleotide sugar dehydrogenase [Pedosphaera sp.]|nr:nucleotide sugar dehydrogenase [Pedosphaera sp.]